MLDKISLIANNRALGNHATYLEVRKTITEENRKIADMFDGLRRSRAYFQIAAMYRHQVMDNDKLSQFSEETQQRIKVICGD